MRHGIRLRLVIGLCSAFLILVPAQAQQPAGGSHGAADTGQTFDAVSIKPSQAIASGSFLMRPGGSLLMDDGLLGPLVALAYGTRSIVDAPDWVSRERFTIRTKAAGNPAAAEARLMLQKMLADRFQLRVHREQRTMPVHVLTLSRSDGKLGPNLRRRTPPCEAGSRVAVNDLAPEMRRPCQQASPRRPAEARQSSAVPAWSVSA